MKILLLPALLLLALPLASCSEVPAGGQTPPPPGQPQGAYATHVVAYGNALAALDQDVLDAYDRIILDARAFSMLEARYRDRALLYFNMWGKSTYVDSLRSWPEWQPAPGELDEPDVVLYDGVHCYRFDDAHVQRFLGWLEDFLAEHGDEVAGLFLDDFGFHRNWWPGEDTDKDLVWGPADGRPGWREAPYTWNVERVTAIENGAASLIAQYCGPGGTLVVNGTARQRAATRRFAENVGAPDSEAWDRLEIAGVDPSRYALPGDLLQVNGVGPGGRWGDWAVTEAGNGLENLQRAASLAIARQLSVGLAYAEPPAGGQSIYSLFLDPGQPGESWPDYLEESGD